MRLFVSVGVFVARELLRRNKVLCSPSIAQDRYLYSRI
jgi:hypothetical protein